MAEFKTLERTYIMIKPDGVQRGASVGVRSARPRRKTLALTSRACSS